MKNNRWLCRNVHVTKIVRMKRFLSTKDIAATRLRAKIAEKVASSSSQSKIFYAAVLGDAWSEYKQ